MKNKHFLIPGNKVFRISNGFAEPGVLLKSTDKSATVIFDWHPHEGIECDSESIISEEDYQGVSHLYPIWDWEIHREAIH